MTKQLLIWTKKIVACPTCMHCNLAEQQLNRQSHSWRGVNALEVRPKAQNSGIKISGCRIHLWEADEVRPSPSKGPDSDRGPPFEYPWSGNSVFTLSLHEKQKTGLRCNLFMFFSVQGKFVRGSNWHDTHHFVFREKGEQELTRDKIPCFTASRHNHHTVHDCYSSMWPARYNWSNYGLKM